MTKLWPAFDEFVADLVNIYEGDAIENVIADPELADKIESEFRDDLLEDSEGQLPDWLDPNVDVSESVDQVVDTIKGAFDLGLRSSGPFLGIGLVPLIGCGAVALMLRR